MKCILGFCSIFFIKFIIIFIDTQTCEWNHFTIVVYLDWLGNFWMLRMSLADSENTDFSLVKYFVDFGQWEINLKSGFMNNPVSTNLVRKHLIRKHLIRKHLIWKHLIRKNLIRKHLTWKHLIRKHLIWKHLIRKHLIWKHLIRKHFIWKPKVWNYFVRKH